MPQYLPSLSTACASTSGDLEKDLGYSDAINSTRNITLRSKRCYILATHVRTSDVLSVVLRLASG